MIIFSKRIFSLVVKELLTLFRDPKGRIVLIAPPILQLLIFAFAATLEVKNISLAVLNQDMGKHSHEIIERVKGSKEFSHIILVKTVEELKENIDEQKAIAGFHIQQDFSRNIEAHQTAKLQIIMDGRRSNAAQIVNNYISDIVLNYSLELVENQPIKNMVLVNRNWFNQNLLYLWSTVPSLVSILSMMISLIITSLSVSRERELGTFDQILVSPLLPYEILIGKTIPAVIVGLAEGLLIWAIGTTVLHVPFTGSFLLLVMFMCFFIISTVGVGLYISSISKTQQQAILGAFIFMVPAITLSGYASPIENMPSWLQPFTWFNPLKHALIIIKGLFLKNMTFVEVLSNSFPLVVISFLTLSLAGWSFSKKI